MKLIINYDLIKEIQKAKEPYTLVKNIKYNYRFYVGLGAFLTSINLLLTDESLLEAMGRTITYGGLGCIFGSYLGQKMFGENGDIYGKKAYYNLSHLVPQLSDLNVHTTYDLLLESEQYSKTRKIFLNENKLPSLLEKKYILVPTYDYLGEIQSTSILQEHVVGSKIYVLSLGSEAKEYRFAYSGV